MVTAGMEVTLLGRGDPHRAGGGFKKTAQVSLANSMGLHDGGLVKEKSSSPDFKGLFPQWFNLDPTAAYKSANPIDRERRLPRIS